MAFPNAAVFPVVYRTSQIPVRGVLWVDLGQQTHHNIFKNSRFVGLHPHILERVGIILDILRYLTDDLTQAEMTVGHMLPLSKVSLVAIRDQLRGQFAGQPIPVWDVNP